MIFREPDSESRRDLPSAIREWLEMLVGIEACGRHVEVAFHSCSQSLSQKWMMNCRNGRLNDPFSQDWWFDTVRIARLGLLVKTRSLRFAF
jgi:hypothetical protein